MNGSKQITAMFMVIDTVPDAFTFIDQNNVLPNTRVISNSITVSGINVPVSVNVSSGAYEINRSGMWSSTTGTVSNGDRIRVRLISSSRLAATTGATLTISGVLDTFSVTTVIPDSIMLSEHFDEALQPAGWTVLDSAGTGAVWTFEDRDNMTGGVGSMAVADSDRAGVMDMDTELRTPVMDASNLSSVFLLFKTGFTSYSDEIVDVDISINGAGGPWTNIWRRTAADYWGDSELIDITVQAAGRPNIMVRFHYYNANFEYWWQIDDVEVLGKTLPVSSVTLTSSKPSPMVLGSGSATFTAQASGGSGNYQYQFRIKDSAGTWTTTQVYSAANTWAWTPETIGSYTIQVMARNAGRTSGYDTYTNITYSVAADPVSSVRPHPGQAQPIDSEFGSGHIYSGCNRRIGEL